MTSHKRAEDAVVILPYGRSLMSLMIARSLAKERDNDIVQAIEDPDKRFFLGLQFHPEILIYKDEFRNIFSKFIAASKS